MRARAAFLGLASSLVAATAVSSPPSADRQGRGLFGLPSTQLAPLLPSHVRFRLDDPVRAAFGFDPWTSAAHEKPREASFFRGAFGPSSWGIVPALSLSLPSSPLTPAAAPLLAEEDSQLRLTLLPWGRATEKPRCVKRPVTIARYGAEQDTLSLLSCDGEVLPDVMDRLSVLLRPPGAERPPIPLPEEPDPGASEGEWIDSVKLLPARLVWVLQRVSDAFPRKTLYVMSGYRRGGHDGQHRRGRAVDLFVMGVPNERVYKFCRTMQDVWCGYYPNNKFVHLDVRRPGSGKAYWIDTSGPSEASRYVDTWPDVEKGTPRRWEALAP